MDNRSIARAASPVRIYRTDTYFSTVDGTLLADVAQASETGKVILPGIKPTYTDELVLGYSRPLSRIWSIDVWGQYRTMKHIIEDFPTLNRDTSPSVYVYGNLDGQVVSYGGSTFTAGKARRVYKAVSLELKKQYSDNWSLSFMYTLSRLEGNWDLDYQAGSALFYASSYLEDGPGLYVSDPNRDGVMIDQCRHHQGQPVQTSAVRVLRRLCRLRRNPVHQAGHPDDRRPDAGFQCYRLFFYLHRQSAHHPVLQTRRRSWSGLVQLPVRGQCRAWPWNASGC